MHKYEFYGVWDDCDFYWNSSVDLKTEQPIINRNIEEPIENTNVKNTNTDIKKNLHKLTPKKVHKNNYYKYKVFLNT
jgi:hypothetical protein